VVNGHAVSMEAYNAEFRQQLQAETDSVGVDPCGTKGLEPDCAIVKQRSLNNVIDAELVQEYASAHGISVTAGEDAVRWRQTFQRRFDNRTDVEHAWLRRIGISESDLRRSLHNDLLTQKVIFAVTANLSPYTSAIRLAQLEAISGADLKKIQYYLNRHVPFLSIATVLKRESLPSCTQAPCGELGWIPTAFVPSNRSRLLTAALGTVVGPIREQLRVLYFYVEGRSNHYKMTTPQLFQLRQLKYASWVQQRQKHAKVTRYIAV
jgi:SurA N-terminal domain